MDIRIIHRTKKCLFYLFFVQRLGFVCMDVFCRSSPWSTVESWRPCRISLRSCAPKTDKIAEKKRRMILHISVFFRTESLPGLPISFISNLKPCFLLHSFFITLSVSRSLSVTRFLCPETISESWNWDLMWILEFKPHTSVFLLFSLQVSFIHIYLYLPHILTIDGWVLMACF